CKVRVWLCQIAKNIFYDKVKSNTYETDEQNDFPSSESLEQKFVDKENALQIHRKLHSLKEPYKEVFTLRVFGELPFSEIASLFSKTESWARVTFYRAKNMILEELK
ncbi:MAG: sigma-70 family RNA polymerase sigma factor, partial [Oscillospiraceae bacterium]